jgi:hypothetical protein
MNPQNKLLKWVGFVLNVFIGGLLLFAAYGKLIGPLPPDAHEKMRSFGVDDRLHLIGVGELVAGLLLIIPWTSPLGTLLTSGFWGGVICLYMAHHEDFVLPSVFLAVTWLGSYLRGSVPLLACNECRASPPASK